MVYCGKPSRGCQMCRTRRIKCDETKPTCNQCAKSRRQCPGYKDDFDLVFRNETQATERRARRAVNSKRVHAQLNFKTSQSTIAPTSLETDDDMFRAAVKPSTSDLMQLLAPASSVSISVDQQAPCYFMSNFVMSTEHSSRGYFDFLVPMLKTEAPDSHLSLAFSAVAMAGLANRPNTRGRALFPAAVAQYTKALRSINIALQDPTKQKTDQTLAAILLLGFFETICSEKSNAMAWYSHMDGAVQLVKMRGRKQLRTKVGYALFASVRAQMSVSCLSGSKAPALGSEWWIADIAKDEKTAFLTKLSLRVAELRVEINDALTSYSRTPEYFQEVLNFMRRAQAMEQEYLDWEAAMPESWKPRTVAWVDQVPGGDISKAAICPGKVDMYDDIWVGHVWNSGRITRMYISGIIVRCAAWVSSPVDYRTTPEYAQAVRLCVDLITDIIASIPFHLGWRVGPNGVLKHPDMSGFQGADDDVEFPKALGGFFCMWPLFSISNTDYITDSQRLWTKGRLMYISEILGLNHAKVLSNFQLRLPSMIIRRDTLMHTPLSAPLTGSIPTSMNRNFPSPPMSGNPMISHSLSANPQGVQAPAALLNDMPDHQASFTPPNSAGYMPTSNSVAQTRQFGQQYALNPLQQREAMQKETWEKERKSLLKKASNQQGESVERLLANYLAV